MRSATDGETESCGGDTEWPLPPCTGPPGPPQRLLLTGTCCVGEAESRDCGEDSEQLQEAGERGWGSALIGETETHRAQVFHRTARTLHYTSERGGDTCSSSPALG